MNEAREIKFRVWDGERMIYPSGANFPMIILDGRVADYLRYDEALNDEFVVLMEDAVLMQYTGLKDGTTWEDLSEDEREWFVNDGHFPSEWDGREIYEGDIAPYDGFDHTVEMRDGAWFLEGEYLADINKEIKVVGNIYSPQVITP